MGELILSWLSLFAAMMFVNMLAGSIQAHGLNCKIGALWEIGRRMCQDRERVELVTRLAATLLFGAVLVCLQNL